MTASGRPDATFGVDVVPMELCLAACGHTDAGADPIVYTTGLPRLAEIFERAGVRATFFVLGRDAGAFSRPLAALAAAGHEIASHSFSSPSAFSRLSPVQMRDEMIASRNAIRSALGIQVTGFRAPQCDLDRRGIDALIATGYRYDASAEPTPWLAFARAAMAVRSRDAWLASRLRAWPFTLRRDPHHARTSSGSLVEFPAAVTPWSRQPVRQAVFARPTASRFKAMIDGFANRGESLSCSLCALDALGLVEDRLDPRLAHHSGMNHTLEQRLERIERIVHLVTGRFRVSTFGERATRFAACEPANEAANVTAVTPAIEARNAA